MRKTITASLIVVLAVPAAAIGAGRFVDVPEHHAHRTAIEHAAAKRWVQGYRVGEGFEFRDGDLVTPRQVSKVVKRVIDGVPAHTSRWWGKPVPEGHLTRGELAEMMWAATIPLVIVRPAEPDEPMCWDTGCVEPGGGGWDRAWTFRVANDPMGELGHCFWYRLEADGAAQTDNHTRCDTYSQPGRWTAVMQHVKADPAGPVPVTADLLFPAFFAAQDGGGRADRVLFLCETLSGDHYAPPCAAE